MPNAVLLGYDLEQPSFRHRMRTLIGTLEAAGWQVWAERFPSGRYGLRTWERRSLLREADVVVLHQIKLSASRHACSQPLRGAEYSTSTTRSTCASRGGWAMRPTSRPGARENSPPPAAGWTTVAAGNDVLAGVARPRRGT